MKNTPLFKKEHLRALIQQAVASYPEECCGMIIGHIKTSDIDEIFPCANIQNKMHEKDPKSYPRTAATAYLMNPGEVVEIEQKAESSQKVIKCIYHSHPDHDAYFSATDKEAAVPFGDIPLYPHASYMVISVWNKNLKEINLYQWNENKKDFESSPIDFSPDYLSSL